jgi:hypothetical protein
VSLWLAVLLIWLAWNLGFIFGGGWATRGGRDR